VDKLRIRGGVPLAGEVRISGAKNAALPIMCAALLSSKRLTLANMPRLMDVRTMARLLGQMGVEVRAEADGRMELEAARLAEPTAPYDLVKTMRAAVLVLGPLLARCGQARVSLPGGCAIGLRPVDQHVKGLQAMGATIAIEHGYMHASAQRLRGARIVMDMVTVTGTENLMMAATLAEGTTLIENAAREPEVVDLARCLLAMGARIDGAGSDVIRIDGVASLHGAQHTVMPDRIETGTYLAAAAATCGHVRLLGAAPDTLDATLEKLRSFVLPGGTPVAAHLHVCRTVCRRAERRALAVEDANPEVVRYLNRLSDLLFILSRGANGADEPLWEPGRNR